MSHGQGENKVKKKEEQMNIGVVLGVGAAHRLDRGRVWCFPDRAVRPGEIRRRCLKKQIKHQKHS